MSKHGKKMIAPIVITVLFLIYLLIYVVMIAGAMTITPVTFLFAVPLIALGTGMIVVLKERIKEIKEGEEDDLSNY